MSFDHCFNTETMNILFKPDMLRMFVCIQKYVLTTTWFSAVGAYGLVTYNYEASVCENTIGNLQCETLQYLFFN